MAHRDPRSIRMRFFDKIKVYFYSEMHLQMGTLTSKFYENIISPKQSNQLVSYEHCPD